MCRLEDDFGAADAGAEGADGLIDDELNPDRGCEVVDGVAVADERVDGAIAFDGI